ncbi:MAG: YdeI/OmpD-associated family protein [bacterium]
MKASIVDFNTALAATPKAKVTWGKLTPIARRDFVSWITSAKQATTRDHRVERACAMLAAGKRRPCCYSIVPMAFYSALAASPKAKATWKELTPTERRDFVDWIEAPTESVTRKARLDKVCATLVAGKRRR